MRERWDVTLVGAKLGFVHYNTASDTWSEVIHETVADYLERKKLGEWSCERPPMMENPHRPVWVGLTRNGETIKMLFCETCRCLVTPPFDGYAYTDYPEDWKP